MIFYSESRNPYHDGIENKTTSRQNKGRVTKYPAAVYGLTRSVHVPHDLILLIGLGHVLIARTSQMWNANSLAIIYVVISCYNLVRYFSCNLILANHVLVI